MSKKKSFCLALTGLIAVQLLCFGPILTHVGFYLDDWATLCFLHFAPREGGYLGLLHYYLFNDSRVLIRPLEVLHFGTIYFFGGDKPFLYHAVNLVFEIICSALFYWLLLRLTGRRALAYIGALLLLVYPSHDSTHYWVICSSVALSLGLYLGSLAAALQARDHFAAADKKGALSWASGGFLLFLLSLLNYETFLPLAAVTVVICMTLTWREGKDARTVLLQGALAAAPASLATAALLVFLKVIVPRLGHGYAHAIKLDPSVMFATIGRGMALNTPPEALAFFGGQAQLAVAALTSSEIIRLIALLLVSLAVLVLLARGDSAESLDEKPASRLQGADMVLVGMFTIFVSYTIFGLSPDYMPTYITLVNRVNTGAAVGVGMIVLGLLQWAALLAGRFAAGKIRSDSVAYISLLGIFSTAALALFTLADWGLSRPWIVSWTTQKQVRESLLKLPADLDKTASILLISCPRYVMWSPVFDGVWDYQNMVRITLNQPDFKANVVSERLSLTPQAIKDVSYGYECGNYSFDKLFLMVAPHPELIPVRTPGAFIDMVERKGMTFGLDKKTLSKWREQSAPAPKLEASH